mgnify:CR=1 FL=1
MPRIPFLDIYFILSLVVSYFFPLNGYGKCVQKNLLNEDTSLNTEHYYLSQDAPSDTVVLYMTGQGDAISMYSFLALDFQQAFHSDVFMYDVRGQGKSSGPRCHVDHYDQHVKDLEVILLYLEAQKYKKIHIISHSMGGLISALYVQEKPLGSIKTLTLIAPFFGLAGGSFYKGFVKKSASLVSNTFNYGTLKVVPFNPVPFFSSSQSNIITHDPEYFSIFNSNPNKCGVPSFSWVMASMQAQEKLSSYEKAPEIPLLMMTAGDDAVVSTKAAKKQCEEWGKIKAGSCLYHEFAGKRHGLVYETEQVRNEIRQLIGQHINP